MSNSPDHDLEKKGAVIDDTHAVPGESFEIGDSTYAKLQRIAGKFSIEQRGIERVPESEKTEKSYINVGTMWLAANLVISSFAIGTLAVSVFQIGFVEGVLTIIFFNLLSTSTVAFFSPFGKEFGLRQMILSRFYFGWYLVKFIAFLNILACLGWSAVNVIVGAQLLHVVNPGSHALPEWAGIIVIAACTAVICMFGYKIVHVYEKWSWIPSLVVFIIIVVQFARSGTFTNIPMGKGEITAAGVLSFGGAVYGFGTGWTSYAADYTCYQAKTQSRRLIFLAVYLGLNIPLIFTEILGLAVMTGTKSSKVYADSYAEAKIGGLIYAVLVPNSLGGFGQFCIVVMALSIIANNCPNIYSIALSMQLIHSSLQRVPRFVWTLVGSVIYVAIAIPGATNFESALENFMLLIAYWLAIYEGISLPEHFIFRKGIAGYEPSDYDQPDKLPKGIAATVSFCFGALGASMGMAQYYYVAPIAKHIGLPQFGGDIGFELAFAFAFVTYVPVRIWEKKKYGR